MIGENDVTVYDRALTLLKAAGYCLIAIILSGIGIAILGSALMRLFG